MGSRSASLTSVALSQVYTSPFNWDKQALAFSDNVQDASHRAGFFAARTYRVNLRTAIRKVIAEAPEELTLADLEAQFLNYWKPNMAVPEFIGRFLPPNMEWLDDYEKLKESGHLPANSNLVHLVERRTKWEITGEFGFNSRIGRTLEKTGAAIAFPDPDKIQQAVTLACARLREHAGGFGAISEREVSTLVLGLVHRLRTSGGIFHPELDGYVEHGGNTYLINQQSHMPSFGKTARAPSFFYQGTTSIQRFERLVAGGTSLSWSQRWVIKNLHSIPGLSAESTGIVIEEVIRALTESALLEERSPLGNRVWGIPPAQLRMTHEVRLMSCSQCGHSISCAGEEQDLWNGSPCLRTNCLGRYASQPPIKDYFGDLYRSGDVVRIRAAEHTGMLDRKTREWTEKRFMARNPDRRGTDPNLLSCTPTLEMGVDIGDLSTVVLCTVPPATSNYVQRIGRAGRKEGSAVSLTIASAQPHDLYYFDLPEDMIMGEIRPPGTFLDAPAVLERQLTAFCFDRWSQQTNPSPVLPRMIDPVLDIVREPEGKTGFPYDFFDFVDANLAALLDGFLTLFTADELKQESRDTLQQFARGEGHGESTMTERILRRLSRLSEERDDLRKRLQKIGAAIRKNRDITARDETLDKELDELKQHRDGTYEMLKQINSKHTLNFFTDEGLLPNYAFPEEGVELRSVILKKREQPKGDEGKYQALTFEYIRPSASAITELAPGNVFYVEGRKLKIDQVGLNVSPLEPWHFCDACGYMELVGGVSVPRSTCPSCESPNWTDASLKRDLVKLRQVVSTSFDRSARSHDDTETRDAEFFNRHESVVIPPNVYRRGYQIRSASVPFGFEFLGKSTMRVVNMGQDNEAAQSFRLAGREVSTGGFVLCPECGKVQNRRGGNGEEEMKHDLSCRNRGRADSAPLKAVFLYRELSSEAIRVLLPSSSAEEDSSMTSFVAALHLGLRLHFGGNIEHLRGCVDDRPVPGTSLRRKYLVLYDQVPGGTGYLKQLSKTPGDFLNVLRLSLKHLTDCECATREDHDTDGCHRCILQSRHSRDHAGLSRTTAMRLLGSILENAAQLEEVERVSDIDIHPLIQSELEKAFLESLRSVPGSRLQPKIVRGKQGYLWCRGDTAWEIGLQMAVKAGPEVSTPSIPDFVLYPVRPQNSRSVAVFLDGYAFHADEAAGHNRIALDVLQRQALVSSGKFWVWSFSWEDIHFRNDPAKIPVTLFGEEHARRRNEQLAAQVFSGDELSLAKSAGGYTSWSLFLEFLAQPSAAFWSRLSFIYGLALPLQLQPVQLASVTETVSQCSQSDASVPQLPAAPVPDGYGGVYSEGGNSLMTISLVTQLGITERNPSSAFVLLRFDDDSSCRVADFSRHWRGLLRLLNRMQFLPHAKVVTVRGCKKGMFSGLTEAYGYFLAGGGPADTDTTQSTISSSPMPDEADMANPAIVVALKRIHAKKLPWPVIGFELMRDGMVVASAEAGWEIAQVAVVHESLVEDIEGFRQAKWTVSTFGESGLSESAVESIISRIGVPS